MNYAIIWWHKFRLNPGLNVEKLIGGLSEILSWTLHCAGNASLLPSTGSFEQIPHCYVLLSAGRHSLRAASPISSCQVVLHYKIIMAVGCKSTHSVANKRISKFYIKATEHFSLKKYYNSAIIKLVCFKTLEESFDDGHFLWLSIIFYIFIILNVFTSPFLIIHYTYSFG